MKIQKREMKTERRGRPKKQVEIATFDSTKVKLLRGNDLAFNESLFVPLKTNTEIDLILSTDGGLMPGISIMIAGGPGSGKSTLVLDMLSKFTMQGWKKTHEIVKVTRAQEIFDFFKIQSFCH